MLGQLTKLISTPHFSKRERGRWGIIQAFAKCGNSVKSRLDALGIENYVPMHTVYDGRGYRKGKEPVLADVIFACWDSREFSGLCSPKNKIHRNEIYSKLIEDGILATMEGYWRAEVISERCPVRLCPNTPEGEPFTPTRGLLAGCRGYLSTSDGHTVFALPMADSTLHIEVNLPAADLKTSACASARITNR